MSTAFRSARSIEQLLDHFGLTADPASVRACGCGIVFRFRKPEYAARALDNGVIFAKGRLGILHGRHIGGVVSEYRSYTDGIGCSLHIVLGKNGSAFADIDRFNPYQGPRQLLLHGILELCPHLVRSAHRGALRCAAAVKNGRSRNAAANGRQTARCASASISVIVPVYQEEAIIAGFLVNLLDLGADEIIVVDGGSTDRTAEIAARYARVLIARPGRAVQMNAGAAVAIGEILLFLHADVRLGKGALEIVRGRMADATCPGGNFDINFEGSDAAARAFTSINRWRRRCGIFYGDSGIFCRREIFEQLGGYRPWPILEDYEFARRLWKLGKLSLLKEPIRVSDRRWKNGGLWWTLWTWFWIQALYLAGVSPHRLAKLYRHPR